MNDYNDWEKFDNDTPGTTPLPLDLPRYIEPSPETVVLDIGCGLGRVSEWLLSRGFSVIASDINKTELENARIRLEKVADGKNTIDFLVSDASKELNLNDSSVDVVNVNGVLLAFMGNIQRGGFMNEAFRVLRPGGILHMAEFSRTRHPEYRVDYHKHSLITGELGTIVSFKPDSEIRFAELSTDEISNLKDSPEIDYFAHHYSRAEMEVLLKKFETLSLDEVEFVTKSNNHINGFVIYAKKPDEA